MTMTDTTRAALRGAATAAALACTLIVRSTCAAGPTAGPAAGPSPGTPDPTAEATGALARVLQQAYPASRFGAVQATPWPGVFEVMVGSRPAYLDASGRYFLFGSLYDMHTQRDLSAERRAVSAPIDFDALPLRDAIREVRGSGSRRLAVFSDPDCGHCRRLEAALRELSDVTIHTFIVPIIGARDGVHAGAIAAWCAHDQPGAWRRLMTAPAGSAASGRAGAGCEHPLQRNLALARSLGLAGTPTLVAGDGRTLAGAASAPEIHAWLDAGTPQARAGGAARKGQP